MCTRPCLSAFVLPSCLLYLLMSLREARQIITIPVCPHFSVGRAEGQRDPQDLQSQTQLAEPDKADRLSD